MKLAVFSDSHDNMENIKKAIELCKQAGITRGLHLGDFCAPPSLTLLAESGLTWQCVWGNVDGDRLLSYQRVAPLGTMDLVAEDFRELEIDGKKLFLTHYPQISRIAALSGLYDACFYGHNHEAKQEIIGKTLLANPGEVAGFRFGKPSFGIYDTETNLFAHVLI